jgi:beta-glucosidase
MLKLKSFKPTLFGLLLTVAVVFAACGLLPAQDHPAEMPDPQADALHAQAADIVKKMTLEEKIDYIGGVHGFYVREMPNLKLPALKMSDGPLGTRNDGPATTFGGGIALAASWDTNLALVTGSTIARDARARGVHFMLGPGVNIYRAPMNGRNFEYLGEDPYLAKQLAIAYIKGMQGEAVAATIKHYMGNNSEFLRHDSNSQIDERTMREIYLRAFEGAVKEAHVAAIMDSYNFVNGVHATQNDFINNQIAKKEWKFDGIIMSDWVATYDGVGAAKGGLDLEMPFGRFMNRQSLLPAIKKSELAESVIDDKVARIVFTALRFAWNSRDQVDLSIPSYSQQGRDAALRAAREGMVLLKNDGNLLPLDKDKIESILVVGPDAYPFVADGGGSARVQPYAGVSFMEGISNFFGNNANVMYSRGLPTYSEMANATGFVTAAKDGKPGLTVQYFNTGDLTGQPVKTEIKQHINIAEPGIDFGGLTESEAWDLFSGPAVSSRWTGYYVASQAGTFDVLVQGAGEGAGNRLYVDDKLVVDNWELWKALVSQGSLKLSAGAHKIVLEYYQKPAWDGARMRVAIAPQGSLVDAQAKAMAAKADAVVVVAGFDAESESEGADRTFALPVGQNDLIQAMAAANKKTIVAVISGGSVDAAPWIDRVPALIEAWYPGQEGGRAFADLLFGVVSPSGKLPISWERRWEDNPVAKTYYPKPGTKDVSYDEGIFVGYRGYDRNQVKPLFPFGFGLSYSTFKYSNLDFRALTSEAPFFSVNFDITNTGSREATDIAQLYVHDPNAKVARPNKELKGFVRLNIKRGETRHVSVYLEDRSFTYFDVNTKKWHADAGDYHVMIGHSSADIELTGTVTVKKAVDLAP